MQPTAGATPPGGGRPWRRYAPLLGVVIVIVIVVAVAITTQGGDDGDNTTANGGTGSPAATGKGPVVFNAETASSVQWGPKCDASTGRVAVPTLYAPPCVEPYDPSTGPNGGTTAPGVTGNEITIALYQAQPDLLEETFLQQSGGDEELGAEAETVRQYIEFFEAHYETWGRNVKLVVVKASGAPDDEEAGRSDAIKVATQVKAFASWGGPSQTATYADELAARGVLCLGDCLLTATDSFAQQRAPHVWLTLPSIEQAATHWGEFIERELVGRKATYAGEPELRGRRRVFGIVRFDESFAGLDQAGKEFVKDLKSRGIRLAADIPYELDLTAAQENARTMITKLKSAKVTTVIYAGDPVTPSTLTREATAQKFFPEWVILGAAYSDSSLFGRQADPEQWKHAFGVSQLPVPTSQQADDLASIIEWQTGKPPAAKTYRVLAQAPLIFYTGLHLAGPQLTPDTFRAGLFRYPSGGTSPTRLHISWGDHGLWPTTDWFGSDDATLIWWDPEASGADEVGNVGKGMWAYSNGGKRYLPGQWPKGAPAVFEPAGSVTFVETLPPDQRAPSYPSPAADD